MENLAMSSDNEAILNYVKSHNWFKVGTWKEPVFIQDAIARGMVEMRGRQAFFFPSKKYFVTKFSQYYEEDDYKSVLDKMKKSIREEGLVEIHQAIGKEVDEEVARAADLTEQIKELNEQNIQKIFDQIKIHGKQSVRFIVLGYALEEMLPEFLSSSEIEGQTYTPEMLLAKGAIPKKLSPMIEERANLLSIAADLKNGKEISHEIEKHAKRYGWMNSLCWWDEPFDSDHYKKLAANLVLENPAEKLQEIQNQKRGQEDEASKIRNWLQENDKKAFEYIDLVSEMADMREESWDIISIMGAHLRSLFKELAKQLGLEYNELMMMNVEEMQLAFKEGEAPVSKEELRERMKGFGSMVDQGSAIPRIFTGSIVVEARKSVEGIDDSLNQLRGMTIWPGIFKGKVVVLKSADELEKVSKGDILVCPMTDPDYMPAIQKAGAVVTDQGGVLCHAAIVARELQKICIVGTHHATKILKDGDEVEVDADKGVVRKIEN